MHIHTTPGNQIMSLGATQATQQAMATRRAAAEVRRKLTSFSADEDGDLISRVDARPESDPDRPKRQQPDEEEFRSVFVSVSA
jgi:hypothetical protein